MFFNFNNPFLPSSLINKPVIEKSYSFDIELKYHWTASLNNPTSDQVMHTPIVADINRDNIPDIIFITFISSNYTSNGTIRVISGKNGEEIFSITGYAVKPSATPAIGDIDNDLLPEIMAVSNSGQIMAFENDGTLKWTSIDSNAPQTGYPLSIALANIDQSGYCEIIVGQWVLNYDSTTKWFGTNSYGHHHSCIADIDMTGTQEIVAGNTIYNSDGSLYFQNLLLPDGYTAIGNFDGDINPEIVLVNGGLVYLLNHDGSISRGPVTIDTFGGGPPAVADIDNDNMPEICIAARTAFTVLDHNGGIKWQKTINDLSSCMTSCSVFDFNNDNNPEVLNSDHEYFRIFNSQDGSIIFEMKVGSGTFCENPVIADVNNDNSAEIIIAANNYFNPAGGLTNGILVFGDKNN